MPVYLDGHMLASIHGSILITKSPVKVKEIPSIECIYKKVLLLFAKHTTKRVESFLEEYKDDAVLSQNFIRDIAISRKVYNDIKENKMELSKGYDVWQDYKQMFQRYR